MRKWGNYFKVLVVTLYPVVLLKQRNNVWTRHSLLLAFLFGPSVGPLLISCRMQLGRSSDEVLWCLMPVTRIWFHQGVLSHLLTRGIVSIFRWDVKDIMEAGTTKLVASAAEEQAALALKDANRELKKAEREASKTVAKAKREADTTLSTAKEQAARILRKAEAEADQLVNRARDTADSTVSDAPRVKTVAATEVGPRPKPEGPPSGGNIGARPRGGGDE